MPTLSKPAADANLMHAVLRNADAHPDRSALIDPDDLSGAISYRRLRQEILHRARYFLDHGLRPGDVAVLNIATLNQTDDLLAFLALTSIGVGVYASSVRSQVEQQVAERLEVDHEVGGEPAAGSPRKAIAAPRYDRSREETVGVRLEEVMVDKALQYPWLVRSTSGTTGDPKVFITTHEQGIFRRDRYYCATGLGGNSIFTSLVLLRFGAARQRVFYALSRGATVIIPPEDVSIDAMIGISRKHRTTHLYAVPIHLELCCRIARTNADAAAEHPLLPDLVNLEASSSPVTPELAASVRTLVSPRFSNSYSVSEVGHISTTRLSPQPNADADLINIGVAVDGVEIAVLDERFEPVPPGTRGAIAVRFASRSTQVDYLDARRQWVSETRQGWFLPGDIGYVSPNGNLIYECRADDMMIFDGVNIYPREIEAVLETHPAVEQAAAFPVPSALHGSIPVAAVVLRSGVVDGRGLVGFCRQRLGDRAPRHVEVMKALPRNAFGKILKRELASRFREA